MISPIIPIPKGRKGPNLPNWQTLTPEQLAIKLKKSNGCNRGVRLDNYAVIDPDSKWAGVLMCEWEEQGELPPTIAWRTAAGNIKRLFKRPPGLEKTLTVKGGLQLRTGAGMQDVIPPSYVKDPEKGIDGTYSWLPGRDPDSIAPADLPPTILAWFQKNAGNGNLERGGQRTPPAQQQGDYSAYARKALEDELTRLAQTAEGGRNNQLNESAFALGQLIGAGALDRGTVIAKLSETAEAIGLMVWEIQPTILSGIEAGIKEPRKLPERERPQMQTKPQAAETVPEYESQAPSPEVPTKPKTSIGEQLTDVSTFISLNFPEKRKIIKPILSESTINMVYGPRGSGKTTLAMGLITAATTEEAFWQWEVETPVPCLYLDGEMATVDVQQRFAQIEALKKPGRQPLIVYCDAQMVQLGLPRANLLDKKWRGYMKQLLLENEIKLWVADNIASLAPGIDENSKQDWDPINQFFLDLRFHGISTIFLHHAGKEGGQRGTSGREDNLDISISLDFPQGYTREDGCRFVCKFVKTRIPHADLPLVADTEMWWRPDENGVYTWVFQNVKKQSKVQVLKLLDEGVTASYIADELKITKGRVSQIKAQAVREGLLTKDGKLTQSGVEGLTKN